MPNQQSLSTIEISVSDNQNYSGWNWFEYLKFDIVGWYLND